jgi:diguanylate cyclase (GGDEF)-like protein
VAYGTAIAAATAVSAALITVLFLSISRIETAMPSFGFYAIREFHIAIRDVTHLRDMLALAELAPDKPQSLDKVSEANDLVYIRFVRIDGSDTASDLPAYSGVVPLVAEAVRRVDGMIAAGLPFDEGELTEAGAELERLVERMNDAYYEFGETVNVDLYSVERDLAKFNYQIAFALAVLSLLAIGTAILLIGRRETIKKLEFMAWQDATTELRNRAWMSANGDALLARARQAGKAFRLFLIDLDHFKGVNDTFGHHIGDMLLKAAAEVLRSLERPDKTIAVRLGGDEFALLAIGEAAEDLGDRMRENLNRFIELDGHQVRIGASIGMASAPEHGTDLSTLLRNADKALYVAKTERSSFVAFSPAILSRIDMRLGEEANIKRALNRDEFFLVWQPQFELSSGTMTGAEALVRWRDPVSGAIQSPLAFIPTAEQSELILDIDKAVLGKACLQAARWAAIANDLTWSVNVSSGSLQNEGYLAHLLDVLKQTGLPPSRLMLEITEGVFMQRGAAALNTLAELRKLGVGLALDDFGSGYSSLGYLADFDLDQLKIDRSFLSDLESSKKKKDIVRGVIALANSLALTVVAEGVENAAQLDFLIAEGCHGAQGFFMAKPMEERLLTDHLAARRGAPHPLAARTAKARRQAG